MKNQLDLAISLAERVLSLPPGGWPETQEALNQLREGLPQGHTMDSILELAEKQGAKIHPDRRSHGK